jgi:hypothetical protein
MQSQLIEKKGAERGEGDAIGALETAGLRVNNSRANLSRIELFMRQNGEIARRPE